MRVASFSILTSRSDFTVLPKPAAFLGFFSSTLACWTTAPHCAEGEGHHRFSRVDVLGGVTEQRVSKAFENWTVEDAGALCFPFRAKESYKSCPQLHQRYASFAERVRKRLAAALYSTGAGTTSNVLYW